MAKKPQRPAVPADANGDLQRYQREPPGRAARERVREMLLVHGEQRLPVVVGQARVLARHVKDD